MQAATIMACLPTTRRCATRSCRGNISTRTPRPRREAGIREYPLPVYRRSSARRREGEVIRVSPDAMSSAQPSQTL